MKTGYIFATTDPVRVRRTYDFKRDVVRDHVSGFTSPGVPRILDGKLEELIRAAALSDAVRRLKL